MSHIVGERSAVKSHLELSLNQAFKKRLLHVKSGLSFDPLNVTPASQQQPYSTTSFVKSRAARVLLAGAGFLADAYDLFVINLVLRLLRDEYPEYVNTGKLSALEGAVASSALFGSVIGQVVAGSLADVVGRKKIFIATAVLITVGCFGSASCLDTPRLTIYGQISLWRFFLGAGVGGEYPLAATVTSESSSAATRGSLMAAVFAMQGVGSLLSVLVVMICLHLDCSSGFTWRFSLAFGAVPVILAFPWRLAMHETETFQKVQTNRRDLISFMSYNSMATLDGGSRDSSQTRQNYFLPLGGNKSNSTRNDSNSSRVGYEYDNEAKPAIDPPPLPIPKNVRMSPYDSFKKILGFATTETTPLLQKQTSSKAAISNIARISITQGQDSKNKIKFSRSDELSRAWKFYKWHIFGTASTWFLLDVVFYANGLFNHEVTALILNPNKSSTSLQDARNSFILCLIGVPGYWLSVFYIERVGRKAIQFNGFVVMALLFVTCGLFHDWFVEKHAPPYRQWLFLLLYSLTFLFSNFGPNATTFVIPGEIYPPEVKATCHGLSAASGKLGAAAGAYMFPILLNIFPHSTLGLRLCFFTCALVAVVGAVSTYYFIPTYSARDLEDPDAYLVLDHDCMQPSAELVMYMEETKKAKAAPYTMVEIIDSADNYCLNPDEK